MRCYRLNEYEWWCGRDAEEAIAAAIAETGCSREELVDGDYFAEADPDQWVRMDDGGRSTIRDMLAAMTGPGLVCARD